MTGKNVLHCLGYDAFGLPAEQYAVQTGQHPRKTTEDNIVGIRRASSAAWGWRHDAPPRRRDHRPRVLPLDPVDLPADLQFLVRRRRRPGPPDRRAGRGVRAGERPLPPAAAAWTTLSDGRAAPAHRRRTGWPTVRGAGELVPGLGTVLANEEVTNEGRSERGNFPVFKRNLRQWMMRITAYADRLAGDLDRLDWPEPIKAMQRNWIGRSRGCGGAVSPRRRPVTSRSSPPAPTRCSAPPSWCWPPSTRSSTR